MSDCCGMGRLFKITSSRGVWYFKPTAERGLGSCFLFHLCEEWTCRVVQCWQWVQLLPWEIFFLAGGMVLGQVWIVLLRNPFCLVDFSGCCCEFRPWRGAKSVLSLQRVSRTEKGRSGDSHLPESCGGSCAAASRALAQHLSHIALSEPQSPYWLGCLFVCLSFPMLRSQDTIYIIVILMTPLHS